VRRPSADLSSDIASSCEIRPLGRDDLDEADRIIRLSFGTFLKLPDPTTTFESREIIRNRYEDTSTVLGAYVGKRLLGISVVTQWGKFGWFGPLVVLPEFWDKGIAKKLMSSTMDLFSRWETTAEGLFTFADSPKHVGLYHRFGFYPRFLTPVMTHQSSQTTQEYSTFSKITNNKQREAVLRACREITDNIYPGLDLTQEILSVSNKKLGDSVLLMEDARVEGFAVCHVGAGTEAGNETCYIKFGAVPSNDSKSLERFSKLVDACSGFAGLNGATKIQAGVNLGRTQAYEELRRLGFKTLFQGVAMQRPNEPGYNRSDVFAMDDWT
jgi:GNAT superfamily N-acetyltransferase